MHIYIYIYICAFVYIYVYMYVHKHASVRPMTAAQATHMELGDAVVLDALLQTTLVILREAPIQYHLQPVLLQNSSMTH